MQTLADEFAAAPCRLTIQRAATGIEGDTFKNRYLMDRWRFQINKTGRTNEIHGFDHALGYRVFTDEALDRAASSGPPE